MMNAVRFANDVFALQTLRGCAAFYKILPSRLTPRHPPLGKEGKARITVERAGTGVLDRPENSRIHGWSGRPIPTRTKFVCAIFTPRQLKICQNQAGCYVYDVTKVKTAYYFYVSALIYCQSFHSYYS